jgi:hypothetical protein
MPGHHDAATVSKKGPSVSPRKFGITNRIVAGFQ